MFRKPRTSECAEREGPVMRAGELNWDGAPQTGASHLPPETVFLPGSNIRGRGSRQTGACVRPGAMRKEPEKGRSHRRGWAHAAGAVASAPWIGAGVHTQASACPSRARLGCRQHVDSGGGLSGARSGSTVVRRPPTAGERRAVGSGKASERGSRGACGLELPQAAHQDQLSPVRLLPPDGSGR